MEVQEKTGENFSPRFFTFKVSKVQLESSFLIKKRWDRFSSAFKSNARLLCCSSSRLSKLVG